MILTIAEALIYLAAIVAGVGGVTFLVYMISLVLWERHEQRAFMDDYRRERAALRAGYSLELDSVDPRPVPRPAPYPTPARSLQHHA